MRCHQGFTTVRAILDKDNSATLRTIEFPEAVLSDLRCEQKVSERDEVGGLIAPYLPPSVSPVILIQVHGTYHLWGNTRKVRRHKGSILLH